MTATRLYMKCHEVEREVCPLHFMIFHVEACSYHCWFISFIHLVMLKNISIKNCWLSLRWLWAFIFLYSFFCEAFLFFFGFGIISGNFCCLFWMVRKNFRNVTSIEILLAFFFYFSCGERLNAFCCRGGGQQTLNSVSYTFLTPESDVRILFSRFL